MELCCYSYILKCYLYLSACVWCAWGNGNLIIHIQSQVCWNYALNGRRQNFDFGKWVSGDPVSYTDLVLLFSTLCTLPVPANPHLSILLEGAWENLIKILHRKISHRTICILKEDLEGGSIQPKGMNIRGSQENRRKNWADFSQIPPSGWLFGQIRLSVKFC